MVWHKTWSTLKVSQETLFPVSWRCSKWTPRTRSVQQRGQVWVTGWSLTTQSTEPGPWWLSLCSVLSLNSSEAEAKGSGQLPAGRECFQAGSVWKTVRSLLTVLPKALLGLEAPKASREPVCLYIVTKVMVLVVKNSPAKCRTRWRCEFEAWVEKIPLRSKWQPTQVLLPRKFHEHWSLAIRSPWAHKDSDTTEWVTLLHYTLMWTAVSLSPSLSRFRNRALRDVVCQGCLGPEDPGWGDLTPQPPLRGPALPWDTLGWVWILQSLTRNEVYPEGRSQVC